jgi:23S rRNA pseudouridine2605 synthase
VSGDRLQKVLSQAGLASRREAESWIRAGRITINGEVAVLGVRVTDRDDVRLDGRPVRRRAPARSAAFVAHRSPGESLIEPAADDDHESLAARMPKRAGRRFIAVSPMPRQDGGLEILCTDGALALALQRATRATESEYRVRVHGEMPAERVADLLRGELDGGARVDVIACEPTGGEGSNQWYAFTARGASGKSVRQLFERHGATVSRVLRVRFGALVLDRSLPRGRSRPLTNEELAALSGPLTPARSPTARKPRARRARAGTGTRR